MPSNLLLRNICLLLLIKMLIKNCMIIIRLFAQTSSFLVSAMSSRLIAKLKVS